MGNGNFLLEMEGKRGIGGWFYNGRMMGSLISYLAEEREREREGEGEGEGERERERERVREGGREREVALERVSMKTSDSSPLFLKETTPPILLTPPFLSEKFEPPSLPPPFFENLHPHPHPHLYREGGSNYAFAFSSEESTFTD